MKIFIYPRSECSGSRGSSFPESMEPLHYVIWVDGREYPGTAGSPYTSRNPMNLLLDGEVSIVIAINLIILVLWIGTGFPKA